MELEIIKKEDKETLDKLAREFSDNISNNSNGNHKVIGLYGTEDKRVLNFFKSRLRNYLLEKGRDIQIMFGKETPYNIDVGFFLGVGYFNGLNNGFLINN